MKSKTNKKPITKDTINGGLNYVISYSKNEPDFKQDKNNGEKQDNSKGKK